MGPKLNASEDLLLGPVTSDSPPALITARMTSSRLPGKVLMKFGRRPLLSFVVDAAAASPPIGQVVVATSDEPSDDPVARWCVANGIEVWRGALEDVAQRVLSAASHLGAENFVRISGDSPMLDPRVISFAVRKHARTNPDLTTNVHPRSFPPGQSVEVIRTQVLESLMRGEGISRDDREHVTPAMYRNESRIRVERFGPADLDPGFSHPGVPYRALTVDSVDDARCFHRLVGNAAESCIWTLGWERCEQMMRAAEGDLRATREAKDA